MDFFDGEESGTYGGGFQSELGYLEAKMKPTVGGMMFVTHSGVCLVYRMFI